MSDPITPDNNPTATPTSAGDTGGQQVNLENFVEKKRFDGLMLKVQQLTEASQSVQKSIEDKDKEIARLTGELLAKDTEKTVTVAERDKQLQELVQSKTVTEKELADLRALQLKVEVVQELGRPELIKILKNIPNLDNKDALKIILEDFARFGDESAAAREKQLLSGITPAVSAAQVSAATPQSDSEWMNHINSLRIGSAERAKAMDDYWSWGKANHK